MKNIINLSDIRCDESFTLAEHTTYRLGGRCKKAYFPKTECETRFIFDELQKSGEEFFVLGAGSNILASDGGYNGSVICTSQLKGIDINNNSIICQSGVTVAELLKFCKKRGLSGLEFLAGIPASVGGLACMNGGAGGKYISDILFNCCVYDGKIHNFSNKLCNFGYKYSTMRNIICLILNVEFKIKHSTEEAVSNNIELYLSKRSAQPKGRSCGCVFKNPENVSAGKLIEECGLKGYNLGGAEVSSKHANFILSNGSSASDVYKLIHFVKKRVKEKFGVCLEEEVVYIGEFNDTFC